MSDETMNAAASEGVVSTHTPGPWLVDEDDDGPFSIFSSSGDSVVSSGVSFGLACGIENAADARLIAAAPDLFSALVALLDSASFDRGNDGCQELDHKTSRLVRQGYAAIAKAVGTEPRTESPIGTVGME